jgi:hypothetical protein
MSKCNYCNKDLKSDKARIAHSVHCKLNPNSKIKIPSYGMKGKTAWSKGLTKENNDLIRKQSEIAREKYKSGERKLTGIAALTSSERSNNAKKQGFGGYRENAGRSKKFYCKDSFGKEVCLQSTYELRCAEILNDLKINWIRPSHIKYNENKKYFPDFYLVDYNIYLDPKNNFLAKKDQEKISCVCDQNNVKVFILTEDKLNREHIRNIVL